MVNALALLGILRSEMRLKLEIIQESNYLSVMKVVMVMM